MQLGLTEIGKRASNLGRGGVLLVAVVAVQDGSRTPRERLKWRRTRWCEMQVEKEVAGGRMEGYPKSCTLGEGILLAWLDLGFYFCFFCLLETPMHCG